MILSFVPINSFGAPPAGYTVVWSDEFNGSLGSTPNMSSWTYNTGNGGWGNHELQDYTKDNAHVIADPNATDGKALDIEVLSDGKGHYTSTRIDTGDHFNFTYGRVEARVKLPVGQGLWPAFWILGHNIRDVGWPDCGELDIMENVGSDPATNRGSAHGGDGDDFTALYHLPKGQTFADGYHTFALNWSPNSITFFVDDIPYETHTLADVSPGGNWVFNDHDFFIVLNCAVGGSMPGSPDATTKFPQHYLVDYVRVYKYTASTAFHGPHNIPGIIQAADYDNGVEGAAYHNAAKRQHDLDLSHNGQWLKYTVIVQATSAYKLNLRMAAGKAGKFHIEDEQGNNVTGASSSPRSKAGTTVTKLIALAAGSHVLKLIVDSAGCRMTSLAFVPTNAITSGIAYKIMHTGTTKCLDVSGDSPDPGAKVQQWQDNGSHAQQWIFTKVQGDYYKLIHTGTNQCLEAKDNSSVVSQNVDNGSDSQLWSIKPVSNGLYMVTNKGTNLCLHVDPHAYNDGAAVDLEADNNNTGEAWHLVLAAVPWEY